MRPFAYQLKQAFLGIRRKTGFAITVVITMGSTLGALLCILTLGYLLNVAPLPYPDQDRLYNVNHHIGDGKGDINANSFTYPGMVHLFKHQEVFEQAALGYYGQDVLTSLANQPTMHINYVTPEWFELLGSQPIFGRLFESTEALDTFNPVAVITHSTWLNTFNSSPDILNEKIVIGGISFRIVGVLEPDFIEPHIKRTGIEAGIWLPWDYNSGSWAKNRWGNVWEPLTFIGKLKPDMSPRQTEQVITPLVDETWQENVADIAFFKGWSINMRLTSFQTAIVGESTSTVFKLLAGVFGLVVIALANVANLFLSRTAEQQRQLSIYAALGAKKSRLYKGLLAESLILMGGALVVALVIAAVGFTLLQTYLATELPRVSELTINAFTLLSAVALMWGCALIFAYLSSKMINYRALNRSLQSSGKGAGVQVSKTLRQALIVMQVSIASTLVFANVTLFIDAINSISQELGYSVDNMVTVDVSIASSETPKEDQLANDMQALAVQLSALPQVEEVSHATSPLTEFPLWTITAVANGETFTPERKRVSHNYFSMIGQPLLEGDSFSEADIIDRNRVVVVNDVFAKKLKPHGGSVVGMQLSQDPARLPHTIVGVVQSAIPPASEAVPSRIYDPAPLSTTELTLKLKAGKTVTREEIVGVIKAIGGPYALFSLTSLEAQKDKLMFTEYTTLTTTAVLAFITLFLAGIGLYGILSYSTQMRRFELGTRMAIGAKRTHLVALIIKENIGVVTLGIGASIAVIGVVYMFNQALLTTYVNRQLFGIFALTLSTIFVLSLLACYWPLRQYVSKPAIYSLRGKD